MRWRCSRLICGKGIIRDHDASRTRAAAGPGHALLGAERISNRGRCPNGRGLPFSDVGGVVSDPQDPGRRRAIKYIIGGAVAACPFPSSARPLAGRGTQEASGVSRGLNTKLGSESNTICHQVRDGTGFRLPKASNEYDVVIIGGGPSGLCSAYRLRDTNFLLLEKEPRLGGNAISEQWNGQWYSTGAAYGEGEELANLCVEIGMQI